MKLRTSIFVGLLVFSTYFLISKKSTLPEYTIQLESAQNFNTFDTNQPHFLFSHGYVRNTYGIGKRQIKRFIKNGIINGPAWFFEYNDTDARTNLAQTGDCSCLNDAYAQFLNTTNNGSCVLIGLSRGGSTALLFTALYKPQNIKALIVEAPFAHVDDVAYQLGVHYLPWAPYKKQIALIVMKYLFPNFNPYHTSPLENCITIDPTIPLLFICSYEDSVVPIHSTKRLIHALQKSGHAHVYACTLQKGKHGYLSYDNQVQQITNAFLARYNLPHDQNLASAGSKKLSLCHQAPYNNHKEGRHVAT